eukprot:3081435-Rhodomonas_salina.1
MRKLVLTMRLALKFQELMTAWQDDDRTQAIQQWNYTFSSSVGGVWHSPGEGGRWWNMQVVSGTKG